MSLRVQIGFVLLASCSFTQQFNTTVFEKVEKKYQLVHAAFDLAQNLFLQGQHSYNALKDKSLEIIDTFLELVTMMNDEMARELRSAVVKFYKIKYFHDFTNYVISMEELIGIVDHCLIEPEEKISFIRSQFKGVIQNFHDIRNFNSVDQCSQELPDEVAAAHCILHQAVLFNETMQDSLVSIVQIKTRQNVEDINSTLLNVQKCLNNFVPNFYNQLLIDAYTPDCGYLKVINASLIDLLKDKWLSNTTVFAKKWTPLVKILKERLNPAEGTLRSGHSPLMRGPSLDFYDLRFGDDDAIQRNVDNVLQTSPSSLS